MPGRAENGGKEEYVNSQKGFRNHSISQNFSQDFSINRAAVREFSERVLLPKGKKELVAEQFFFGVGWIGQKHRDNSLVNDRLVNLS